MDAGFLADPDPCGAASKCAHGDGNGLIYGSRIALGLILICTDGVADGTDALDGDRED